MTIPTNVADAAQAINDGTLGVIEDIMIGDLLISALMGLQTPLETVITRKPIQEGFSITDAAVHQPQGIQMMICLANPDFSIDAGIDAALSGSFAGFTDSWRDKS